MIVYGVLAALFERDAAAIADGATNFLRSADYDIEKGLTRRNRLNMFCALSTGRRASPVFDDTLSTQRL
jgi:hypothetical protein